MADEEKKPYLWRWATIIALVGLTLGLGVSLAGNLGLFRPFTTDHPDLSVAADLNKFRLPPSVDHKLLPDDPASPPAKDDGSDGVQSYLVLSLLNTGNQPADSVRVQPKCKGTALLKWDNGNTETKQFKHDIEVGTLEIQQAVEVSIWTPETLADTVQVIHGNGSVPVVVPVKQVASRSLTPWLLAGFVLSTALMLEIWYSQRRHRMMFEMLGNWTSKLKSGEMKVDDLPFKVS